MQQTTRKMGPIGLIMGAMSFVVSALSQLWSGDRDDKDLDERVDIARLMDDIKEKSNSKKEGDMEKNRTNEDWAMYQLEKVQEDTKPVGEKTRDLMTGILTKWSCQWEVDENGNLVFHYQGGYFQASFCEEVPFLYLYYVGIYSVETYQRDKMERVKELVNRLNRRTSVKMVYVVVPDDGEMLVHIEDFFVLVPEIPNVENYLQLMLRRFFQLHHDFLSELEKENE